MNPAEHRDPEIAPEERVEFVRARGLSGVEVKNVHGSSRLWRRFNERYAFSAVVSAESTWQYRSGVYQASAGVVTLMEPGEMHVTLTKRKPVVFRTLFVTHQEIGTFARELGWNVPVHFKMAFTREPAVFRAVTEFCAQLAAMGRLERESNLLEVLRIILANTTQALPALPTIGRERDTLRRARSYLADLCTRDVSLKEMADEVGVTRFHLLRLFRRHTGVPPHTYHVQLRLAHARALLARGVIATDVARQTGFFDQSHLSRHFSRELGLTPGQYAQQSSR